MDKVIKTPEEYAHAIERLHSLLDLDPQPGTSTADQIELLALLIAAYERDSFDQLPAPTPIEAIRFRMEQLDLTQKDLASYVGSPSRASEILSGKRRLTLPMIRAISAGLNIPASLLISDISDAQAEEPDLDWAKLPISEMITRGWIAEEQPETVRAVRSFILPVLPYAAAFRRSAHFRGARNIDSYALLAWLARIWHRADKQSRPDSSDDVPISDLIQDVIRLSWSAQGPLLAVEFLEKHGVAVIVEPALPRTFLDGATLFRAEGPVIGLTLRFDRLDNFWYTLVHELAHVALHSSRSMLFIDDLESGAIDEIEKEADAYASEALIPPEVWRSSPASRLRSHQAVEHLARQLRISPAIVAGRVRREFRDFRVLSDMVGQRAVRRLFPDVIWEEGSA
jgi:HTH-type transcriptional regulator / antitoxin HigA